MKQPEEKSLMVEKDGLRGVVPSSANGKYDEVYGNYLEGIEVATSPAIQQELAKSADPRFRAFLERISNPGRAHLKLQTIAKQCGIDMVEFGNWMAKSAGAIAVAKAQLKAAGIVEDMAMDAMSRQDMCERCDGMSWVAAPPNLPVETPGYRIIAMQVNEGKEEPVWGRTCPKCSGVGKVRVVGDEHSRDRVLEIAGVIQKGSKGAVQIVQNFGGAGHASAINGELGMITVDVEAE